VSAGLLDTSIVIADLSSRLELPEVMAISVITVGELGAGVKMAADPATRSARQRRLNAIREAFEAIPVDERVSEHYGDALAAARADGRSTKATDLIIIATAAATGRQLHTLDKRQATLAKALGVQVA
jgi:predicted nucleic acid-binding protein